MEVWYSLCCSKNRSLDLVMSQLDLLHTLRTYFSKIHFNIFLPSMSRPFQVVSSLQVFWLLKLHIQMLIFSPTDSLSTYSRNWNCRQVSVVYFLALTDSDLRRKFLSSSIQKLKCVVCNFSCIKLNFYNTLPQQ